MCNSARMSIELFSNKIGFRWLQQGDQYMALILVYVSMVIDLDVLLPQIGSVKESFDEAKSKYLKDHRVHEKDARITIYSYCCGAIDSALLYLIFRNYELPTDTWWDSLSKKFQGSGISKPPIRKPSLELLRKRVDHYWSTSFFILLFSSFESAGKNNCKSNVSWKI